mgnify:CR=1 FL=1
MMTTTTVMTRESRRRRRQTVINDATAYKKTKGGVQTSARSKRTGRERGGGGGGKTPLPFCEEEERCEHFCRDFFRVVCVLWSESKRTQRKTFEKNTRARERENTNQPTKRRNTIFVRQNVKVRSFPLSSLSLSLSSLSLSQKCVAGNVFLSLNFLGEDFSVLHEYN